MKGLNLLSGIKFIIAFFTGNGKVKFIIISGMERVKFINFSGGGVNINNSFYRLGKG